MKKQTIIMSIVIAIIILFTIGIYAGYNLNKTKEEENNHLIQISFNELENKVKNKDTFILVLTQEECGHCHEYKPILKRVLRKEDVTAYELEIDKLSTKESGKLKDIVNISGTPTTVFIQNGEEKNSSSRLVGSKTESQIVERLKGMGYIK